ncbi:hypothetical protein [Pseudoclavibacter soli]|uniref:hypothetical protein n=1 Tax=Pseudoclavibacter soli TaxID=452623 RepID=UPI000417FFD8|nr:hypothetical protein [Pseudoclavibacter soli]
MANPAQSWQLRLAAALLTLEAVAALGWAAWLALEMVIATPQSVPLALALIVVLVGFGLWVLLAARGLRAGRAWARSAAVFVQLVMTALGVGSLGGSTSSVVICLALVLPAVVEGVLLFTPAVVEATSDRSRRD